MTIQRQCRFFLVIDVEHCHASTWVFAVSVIASGLSAATTATQAAQIILSGFLNRRIPIWLRRLITMVPSFLVIFAHFDPTQSLVVSQVILSFSLPLTFIPLVMFTGRKDLMGNLVNKTATKSVTVLIVAVDIALNVNFLYGTFTVPPALIWTSLLPQAINCASSAFPI